MSELGSEPEFKGPIASGDDIWKKVSWVMGFFLILLMVTAVAVPILLNRGGHPAYLSTIQNAKQLGYALYNFEADFASFPNDETARGLDDDAILSSAGGSNYYFSQLIADGYIDHEGPFFARDGKTFRPDEKKSSPDEILQKGEVGFAYVLWDSEISSDDIPYNSPLAIAYLEKDQKIATLDQWHGSRKPIIVVLRKDMSVEMLKANRRGVVKVQGKDYFDWSQPHWGGQKPKIVWPE